jgi:hypothetical protein
MDVKFNFKSLAAVILQVLAGTIAFVISLLIANVLAPLPPSILEQTPAVGFLPSAAAMALNAIVNAGILVWVSRRSSYAGLARAAQLYVLSFGAQTLLTQIETAYFISAFPLLQGNFEVYRLILRGLISSAVFVLLVAWITGAFRSAARRPSSFRVDTDRAVRQGAWLAAAYLALYLLFGYFVAWQSQELRLFYGGPSQLNSFFNQIMGTLMSRPEFPAFQYLRGVLWILCLVPLFKGFNGRRGELVVLSALSLGLLPTAALAFPNPLMPAGVSMFHFWETSISMGIFGALCAWFVPSRAPAEGSIEIPARAAAQAPQAG